MTRLNSRVKHDAAFWDAAYARGDGQRWTIWGDAEMARAFGERIPRFSDVLLVACGRGHAINAIDKHRSLHDIYWSGIDFVDCDREGNALLELTGNFARHDLNKVPWGYSKDYFDYAICSEILESLEDPAAAVRECQRIARRTMITLPVSMDLLSDGHLWLFERADAEALLPGCEVVELRGGKLLACFQK